MSRSDTIWETKGIPALLRVFGDAVTVTPEDGSAAFNLSAMLESRPRYAGEIVAIPESAHYLQCAKASWPEPKRGDLVTRTDTGAQYQVDMLDMENTDSLFVGVWLIHV